MVTFGLVHGAYHGSWCWQRLTPELKRLGPECSPWTCQRGPQAGASEYAAAALGAFAEASEDLVVVGHSLAGQLPQLSPS
jgi:hypothetical protein